MKTDERYFKRLNAGRIRLGIMGSDDSLGNNGAFVLKLDDRREVIAIISDASDLPPAYEAWEHVSLRVEEKRKGKWHSRIPTWMEMAWAKDFFWAADECVVQYHPPKDDYVNQHPHVLHLWKPLGVELPRPPKWMVVGNNWRLPV